jgi:splicing factor 3A subunit 2
MNLFFFLSNNKGGHMRSSQQDNIERKQRMAEIAMETIDLAKDPYFMKNHLGSFECKLCLTLHMSAANYLAHTQGLIFCFFLVSGVCFSSRNFS